MRTSQFDNSSPRKMAKDMYSPNKRNSLENVSEGSSKNRMFYSTTITAKKCFVISQKQTVFLFHALIPSTYTSMFPLEHIKVMSLFTVCIVSCSVAYKFVQHLITTDHGHQTQPLNVADTRTSLQGRSFRYAISLMTRAFRGSLQW